MTKGAHVDVVLAARQADLRLSLEMLLSEEPGVSVMGVAGEAGVLDALVRSALPRLVIIDWDLMRDSDHADLLRPWREEGNPQIIALGSEEADRDRSLNAGAHACVLKGEPPELLLSVIRNLRADALPTDDKERC